MPKREPQPLAPVAAAAYALKSYKQVRRKLLLYHRILFSLCPRPSPPLPLQYANVAEAAGLVGVVTLIGLFK